MSTFIVSLKNASSLLLPPFRDAYHQCLPALTLVYGLLALFVLLRSVAKYMSPKDTIHTSYVIKHVTRRGANGRPVEYLVRIVLDGKGKVLATREDAIPAADCFPLPTHV